jgi:ATP-dependent DNA helicase DinG
LYVARDLPDPGKARERWLEGAGDRLCELVNAAGGRALVLCTSYANVKRFAALLRERTEHEILEQGDRDAGALAQAFVDDETSVLVGTRSFWAGIDPAGAACVLVVIDKIPFPTPDDPLFSARRDRAQQRGANPFAAVDLPAASLVLAQGVGRLLRRPTDRGVVAVLDSRLALRPYRAQLLEAVAPLRRSIDLAQTCAFLEEVSKEIEPPVPQESALTKPAAADPRTLRMDVTIPEAKAIRNAIACPVCDAEITERCFDENGTSAFLHDGRVQAAPT